MPKPWPPPPDLASIQELVRNADPEAHLADGATVDEYEPEEEAIFAAIQHLPTSELVVANVLPKIDVVWRASFGLSDEQLAERQPALLALAREIERFFGPDSKPRTRGEILADNEPA